MAAFFFTALGIIFAIMLISAIIKMIVRMLPVLIAGTIGALIGLGIMLSNEEHSKASEESQGIHSEEQIQEQIQFHEEVLQGIYQKRGVNLKTLHPSLDTAIVNIVAAFQQVMGSKYSPTVTSGDDYNGHCKGSAHYSGAALDFRLKDIDDPDQREMVTVLVREALGDRFFVDHESIGTANEHLHVQLRKGSYTKVAGR